MGSWPCNTTQKKKQEEKQTTDFCALSHLSHDYPELKGTTASGHSAGLIHHSLPQCLLSSRHLIHARCMDK